MCSLCTKMRLRESDLVRPCVPEWQMALLSILLWLLLRAAEPETFNWTLTTEVIRKETRFFIVAIQSKCLIVWYGRQFAAMFSRSLPKIGHNNRLTIRRPVIRDCHSRLLIKGANALTWLCDAYIKPRRWYLLSGNFVTSGRMKRQELVY